MSQKSGLEQNATCIKQVMEKEEWLGLWNNSAPTFTKAVLPLSPEVSCCKEEKGDHMQWGGRRLRSISGRGRCVGAPHQPTSKRKAF